jgi:hypothetical protein
MFVAALVAPLLALFAYFAVDWLFGEKPQPAQQGESYPLVEMPNCRYASGRCGLKNADFELTLTLVHPDSAEPVLELASVFPLQGVMVARLRDADDDAQPEAMQPADPQGLAWSLALSDLNPGSDRLRLVASAEQSLYYGEVVTVFARHREAADE